MVYDIPITILKNKMKPQKKYGKFYEKVLDISGFVLARFSHGKNKRKVVTL